MFRVAGGVVRQMFNVRLLFLAGFVACFPFCATPLAAGCPAAPTLLGAPSAGQPWTPQIQFKGNPTNHNAYISWGDNTTVRILPVTKETVHRSGGGYFIWSAPPHTYATPGPKAMDIWVYPHGKNAAPCKYTLVVNVF